LAGNIYYPIFASEKNDKAYESIIDDMFGNGRPASLGSERLDHAAMHAVCCAA
jgi:hypothetical protein